MAQYLPIFRPGDTVTCIATSDIIGGQPVQVGSNNSERSVEPAAAGSESYVGVAGHNASTGDRVTVEIGKTIHLLTAVGSIARGALVEAAAGGVSAVDSETGGSPFGIALTAANDGEDVQILQR